MHKNTTRITRKKKKKEETLFDDTTYDTITCDHSRQMGLKRNIAKTKVMVVDKTPINVNNVPMDNIEGYVYLGNHYSLTEKNKDKEIQRRIMAGWPTYAKHGISSNATLLYA